MKNATNLIIKFLLAISVLICVPASAQIPVVGGWVDFDRISICDPYYTQDQLEKLLERRKDLVTEVHKCSEKVKQMEKLKEDQPQSNQKISADSFEPFTQKGIFYEKAH